MAERLAASARDRALQLTPRLALWPDALGVASTATIVSHYTRRGDYRVHAAAVGAEVVVVAAAADDDCGGDRGDDRGDRGDDRGDRAAPAPCGAQARAARQRRPASYTHTFVKGDRERSGEDVACGLLTFRALAAAAGLPVAESLATLGVRRPAAVDSPAADADDAAAARRPRVNTVGDRAEAAAVEHLPEAHPIDPAATGCDLEVRASERASARARERVARHHDAPPPRVVSERATE